MQGGVITLADFSCDEESEGSNLPWLEDHQMDHYIEHRVVRGRGAIGHLKVAETVMLLGKALIVG